MYPHERSLVEGKPFALLGINGDDNREDLKKVLEKEHITWRSWWNGPEGTSGPIATQWNVHGWPTLYILDHKGAIRHKFFGFPAERVLDKAIEDLIKEAEGRASRKSEN